MPLSHPVVICACGTTVLLTCTLTTCTAVHPWRQVDACGACTATGGIPVVDTGPDGIPAADATPPSPLSHKEV